MSFDKLSELPAGGHVPEIPHQSQQQHRDRRIGKRKKKGKEYRFKVQDRVVAFNKDGIAIHGTVRWVGLYSLQDEKKQPYSVAAVGIETVST